MTTALSAAAAQPALEASQAARRILADGHARGIALVPDNDWGLRIAASFGEQLQAGGGRLLELLDQYGPSAFSLE